MFFTTCFEVIFVAGTWSRRAGDSRRFISALINVFSALLALERPPLLTIEVFSHSAPKPIFTPHAAKGPARDSLRLKRRRILLLQLNNLLWKGALKWEALLAERKIGFVDAKVWNYSLLAGVPMVPFTVASTDFFDFSASRGKGWKTALFEVNTFGDVR